MALYKRCTCTEPNRCDHPWWVRFQLRGHEVRRSTRTAGRREAAVELRRLRAECEGAAPDSGPRRRGRGVGLAELAGADVERSAAAGSTAHHRSVLEWQWAKVCRILGADTDPRSITFDVVERYIATRRTEGAKGQTISREVSALRRGLKIARRRGWILHEPADWPKVKRDPRGARGTGRLHPPSILAAWLRELPQDARDEATLALLTGLRRTELHRLTAAWVEPSAPGSAVPAVLRIPAEAAKARREGLLPLTEQALAVILRLVEQLPDDATQDTTLLSGAAHTTAYRLARQRIGYATPISLRDLRKTWATLTARAVGVDAAFAGLRHSSLATTTRYVDSDLGRVAAGSLAVEAAILGTAGPAQAPPETGSGSSTENDTLKREVMERATRFELATFSLEVCGEAIAEHLSTCEDCRRHVLACAEIGQNLPEVGTGRRHSGAA